MPSVHIKTYGCQMNERDSEAIAALLVRSGYTLAADEAGADIVIVNTCSVRAKAEDKAIGKLRLISSARNRRGRLAVTLRRRGDLRRAVCGGDALCRRKEEHEKSGDHDRRGRAPEHAAGTRQGEGRRDHRGRQQRQRRESSSVAEPEESRHRERERQR